MFVHERDFIEAENIPQAVRDAYEVMWALRDKKIDWAMRRDEIELALKVLCDGVGGSPPFAHNTLMLIQPDLRVPERWEDDGLTARAVRRACDLVLMAEVAHRCERYRQAVVWSEVALGGLQEATSDGSTASLLKTVSASKRSPLAAATKAVVSIWVPSVRRTTLPLQVKEQHYRRIDPFIDAFLASGQTYGRSEAFGSQGLFLDAERLRTMEEPDSKRIDRLAEIRDVARITRSDSKRARATAPLVEMEFFKAVGDFDAAREQAILVKDRLLDFPLPRHLERMGQYRYLDF